MAGTKKTVSKWTRIATEGATTDGRKIERKWIEEMAAQYSRDTYGARLNCEHLRSMWPGGDFGAYGDVLALKAEETEINGEKKLALFAQIEPTASLVELNKKGQKIYTSIEVQPEFADTGKAYLIGLAITDSPASLGTEALQFSAQHGTLANRKQNKDNLFTAAELTALEFEEVEDESAKVSGLFSRVLDALGKNKEKQGKDAALFTELGEAIEALAGHAKEQSEAFSAEAKARKELASKLNTLETAFHDLLKRLGDTPSHHHTQRPVVSGGDGKQLATF